MNSGNSVHNAQPEDLLASALGAGNRPFPWQTALLDLFLNEKIPAALDIPTGLGKTAVMAIWLVAGARRATIPRRLVYVVDRRAVVDQATEFAERLASNAELLRELNLDKLPISTLRGQHVDNREWLADPTRPAIIVGTVDMIGSRLLFEGYGVSRKMRPYHAGLMAVDALVVLDEAHLVPPFEHLVSTVQDQSDLRSAGEADPIPAFRCLSLSATGRDKGDSFRLTPGDFEPGAVTRKRLDAVKRLTIEGSAATPDNLMDRVWTLSGEAQSPGRYLVFCHKRDNAENAAGLLRKKGVEPILLVGARRVHERERDAEQLKNSGFLANSTPNPNASVFLIATSAGEVGVDLDADHMVCDLVAWERMVQRLGRVNRRGERTDTQVIVLTGPRPEKEEDAAARENQFRALQSLPHVDDSYDASPGAILRLKDEAGPDLKDLLGAASTLEPLRPALTRPLLDAWSMTSLREHTGRPKIQPWLRGWVEEDPQTNVIWRKYLPKRDETAFFEAVAPHLDEKLETETYRVVDWLMDRAKAADKSIEGRVAISLDSSGDVSRYWTLDRLRPADSKSRTRLKDDLFRDLAGATLIVDASLGGLALDGLLNDKHDEEPPTADGPNRWETVPFRVRVETDPDTESSDSGWIETTRFEWDRDAEGEVAEWLIVEKQPLTSTTEDGRATSRQVQLLNNHQDLAKDKATAIATALRLEAPYAEMLAAAAALHDEGKRSPRWQRAFRAPLNGDGPYAKTKGPINQALLGGYRHELASMRTAAAHPTIAALPQDLRDLALHLIAAHHGGARPTIGTDGFDDLPPSSLEGLAREVALRYIRLQRRWGPWGLAWWESLLRAADQQASRELEELP
ncbi:MAG: type I-U CRISPR-associated helicase/endonuclease Cas3 [Bryobacteraceae bacterium]